MPPTTDLWAAYLGARLLRTDGEPWADGFVVTAHNPGSVPHPDTENQARHQALVARLDALGLARAPTLASAPDGGWPEPGFLLLDADRSTALALARDAGQLAIYEVRGATLRVVDVTGQRRGERPLTDAS